MNVTPTVDRSWVAELSLRLGQLNGHTALLAAKHLGPLRVQKSFSQPDGSCHLYLLHPPGGIVGGDTLAVEVRAEQGARVLITSPSATRFYRSPGQGLVQKQDVQLSVAADAHLEWVPLETILFNGAEARIRHTVQLAADATYLGWEMFAFGRRASSETFDAGCLKQESRILVQDQLIHRESLSLDTRSSNLLNQQWGTRGSSLVGTLVAVTLQHSHSGIPEVPDALLTVLRDPLNDPNWGITSKGRVILVRYLGDSAEQCLGGFDGIRARLAGEGLIGSAGNRPRIWNT